ncbi:MAG: universal stress protein [Chloroflexi bacterium RBG_19FT_COMBO_48_23]|nr:MAG: universal stress protein [Chloroflexi bacterium RBG_19FT_COMBO_48_23]
MKLERILVAASGKDADVEAVKLACDLAKKSKAKVHVVYVIEVKRSLPLDAVIESEIEKAEKVLTRAEEIAADRDCEVETDLIQAREVGPAIVDEAMEREVDLILMGVTHKKRFGVFDLGRVIPYVLEEAPCRVLLCREPMA